MKFDDVITDIKKMIGITIHSIRAGSDITILKVDEVEGRYELLDSSHKSRQRKLSELRVLWDKLCVCKMLHVDTVLGGSGTCRNQPETILANLPYVEWLIKDGKKNLSYVGKTTHALGELKKMDALAVHELSTVNVDTRDIIPFAIIITEETRLISDFLEGITGLSLEAVSSSNYRYSILERDILVLSRASFVDQIALGLYLTIPSKIIPLKSKKVTIMGIQYSLIIQSGINFLVYKF
jgi:hypothetical protein